ncbi:MAG: TonB-dependent receptor, partial [Comamonas sp.]
MSDAIKSSNKAGLHCELTQLALATGLCVVGASAFAQETALSTVTVQESAMPALKVDTAPSTKFTAPLIDTPKTVTVINEELIKQTGATSLQEALKATPGITFGNGEGGNPTGDQPFIRGSDAQGSTFVDGMRDIAAGNREIFNLETVEVIKGADSAYAGRGGAGGSINLSTKKAKNEDFVAGDVGLGTDRYKRATLDFNRKLNDTTGFRLNAMAHDADIAGRNGPKNQRWGIAPTVTFGMGTATEVTLSWQHLESDDIPDSGNPYEIATPGNGIFSKPTNGGNRNNWYGLFSRDFDQEKSDVLTASVEHKFNETNSFRNSTRYSSAQRTYVWTQPDDSKGNVANGKVYLRGNGRDSEVSTIQNVSEFTGRALAAGQQHDFAVGLELSREKSASRSASGLSPNPTNCTVAAYCTSLYAPNNYAANPMPYQWNEWEKGTFNEIDTIALYGFDTIKLTPQWLINGGLRFDHYTLKAAGPESRRGGVLQYNAYNRKITDSFINYQVGVVYKPSENGSIYISTGTSTRPGGASLGNGDEDLAVAKDLDAALEAEKTRAYEIGTKWDLLDKKLGLTAALFRNEVTNVRITDASGATVAAGNKVVNGLEIGFTGQITKAWNVFGGYTYMDSQRKKNGKNTYLDGKPFTNTPEHSASLWTSYKPMAQLTLGLGATAQSKVYQGFNDKGGAKGINGYARYDAMASYQFNPNLALQVNVYNLTDKVYY